MKPWKMPERMKLASIWVVWAFLAIGALGWALFVVLDFFSAMGNAAAWVQAIGSIIAIFIAVWVPWKTHQLERQAAIIDGLEEEYRVTWLCECACKEAAEAIEEAASGEIFRVRLQHSKRLESCVGMINKLFEHNIPRSLMDRIFSVNSTLQEVLTTVEFVRSQPMGNHDFQELFGRHVEQLRECQRACQAEHIALGEKLPHVKPPTRRITQADG